MSPEIEPGVSAVSRHDVQPLEMQQQQQSEVATTPPEEVASRVPLHSKADEPYSSRRVGLLYGNRYR